MELFVLVLVAIGQVVNFTLLTEVLRRTRRPDDRAKSAQVRAASKTLSDEADALTSAVDTAEGK